jgi:hypothetical protein
MGTVLGIIAIAGLLGLAVASMTARRGSRAEEKEQAHARANVGQAQHESSLRRRAEVRAAPQPESAPLQSQTDE